MNDLSKQVWGNANAPPTPVFMTSADPVHNLYKGTIMRKINVPAKNLLAKAAQGLGQSFQPPMLSQTIGWVLAIFIVWSTERLVAKTWPILEGKPLLATLMIAYILWLNSKTLTALLKKLLKKK